MGEPVTSLLEYSTGIVHLTVYDKDNFKTYADEAPTVTITKDPLPVTVVSAAEMKEVGLGEYEYYWDTEGVSPGTYEIEVKFSVNGIKRRLVKTITVEE